MTVEFARQFILRHPEARYKGARLHAIFLQALEVIERHKREFVSDTGAPAPVLGGAVLQNPNWGRMRR